MTTSYTPLAHRSRSLLGFVVSLALFLGFFATRTTHAQNAEKGSFDIKTRYEHAVNLYKSGQYEKAIEEFQAVYEQKPTPILLFNLAQAHRKAGHKAQALDLYERFRNENEDTEPKLKSDTEQYIAELKAGLEAEKQASKAAAAKVAAEQAAVERSRKFGPTRPLNIAKWTLAGVGVALIVAGGVLLGLDGRPVCSADMPQMTGQKLCPNELDTRLTGGVVLGAGVAALGTSAALFIVDYKQLREANRPPMVALNVSF